MQDPGATQAAANSASDLPAVTWEIWQAEAVGLWTDSCQRRGWVSRTGVTQLSARGNVKHPGKCSVFPDLRWPRHRRQCRSTRRRGSGPRRASDVVSWRGREVWTERLRGERPIRV